MKILKNEYFIISIMFGLSAVLLGHYFKNDYIIFYSIVLFIFSFLAIVLFFYKDDYFFLNSKIGILYLILLFGLVLTSLNSFIFIEVTKQPLYSFATSFSRLWIMPLTVILFYGIISSRKDIKLVIGIYCIAFILSTLPLIYQQIYGQLDAFPVIYNATRYGVPGYSTFTGSITSFGIIIPSVIFLIVFVLRFNPLVSAILIALISAGAVSTMSKAALLNVILSLAVISIFFYKNNIWKILLYLLSLSLIGLAFSNKIYQAFTHLFANTFGVEITSNTISHGMYMPLYQRIIRRVTADGLGGVSVWEALEQYSIYRQLFGSGVAGSGGAVGFLAGHEDLKVLTLRDAPFSQWQPMNTTHNSFTDFLQMGGLVLFFGVIMLIFAVLIKLFKLYIKDNDQIALALFLSCLLIFVNMSTFNGAIFHAYISFPFWIAVLYVCNYKNLSINKA